MFDVPAGFHERNYGSPTLTSGYKNLTRSKRVFENTIGGNNVATKVTATSNIEHPAKGDGGTNDGQATGGK